MASRFLRSFADPSTQRDTSLKQLRRKSVHRVCSRIACAHPQPAAPASTSKTWTRPASLGVLKSVAGLNGALNSPGKGLLIGYDAHNVGGITVG
jgi:hypothetical protein